MPTTTGCCASAGSTNYLTDWVGDDGWVVSQRDEIRKFNYHGDVYFLFGEVTGRREGDGRWLVDVPVRATNQRGEDTIKGTTVIELPSREHGAVLLPEMLAGLQRRAVEMMSRHGESLRGGGR